MAFLMRVQSRKNVNLPLQNLFLRKVSSPDFKFDAKCSGATKMFIPLLHGQISDAASQRGILINDIDEELDLNDP
ncbi:hypothetical protein [Roseinatronobacter thiooxidans]|uniref:hypothetical protein n=1 Tax=Roseinatronobacter thiooxidans TaxID=121821 RepID=UPI001474C78B|nr:hypothetical protein [Roseinatronobacter thiooxidans]